MTDLHTLTITRWGSFSLSRGKPFYTENTEPPRIRSPSIIYTKNPGNISARIIAILFDKILANLNILPKFIAN